MIESMNKTSKGPHLKKSLKQREHVVLIVLGLFVLAQLTILLWVGIIPAREKIRSVWDLPAQERSATLGFGDDFRAYVKFLNDQIPVDANVIVPPMSVDNVFGNAAMMQYFLFPKRIVNCPGEISLEECVERLHGDGVYILATGAYHLVDPLEIEGTFISFSAQSGLILPQP
jgi:hypothetical protein